jgi:hypothetical protein
MPVMMVIVVLTLRNDLHGELVMSDVIMYVKKVGTM